MKRRAVSRRPASWLAAALLGAAALTGCATLRATGGGNEPARPARSVHGTLRRAIALLERYECAAFAVEFLSPIKRAQIEDLQAYRQKRSCSPEDPGNVEDVILALRLALGAKPDTSGVRATIDLSGLGLGVTTLEFVKYVDGRWYFNAL